MQANGHIPTSAAGLPGDLQPMPTGDGSFTLHSAQLDEHYHSRHGAATESQHVFINHGLLACRPGAIRLLEVGLGTGLNALLTWNAALEHNLAVDYTALEPYPLPKELWSAMGHAHKLGLPHLADGHARMMAQAPGETLELAGGFRFRQERTPVQQLAGEAVYDLVYFDAFAPGVQPDAWTEAVFRAVERAMAPGGIMVTYCAKGDVRRALADAGLVVERLQGAPGKRHMVRATRPA